MISIQNLFDFNIIKIVKQVIPHDFFHNLLNID